LAGEDDAISEAEQRLAAALERIADMADQGLSRTPARAFAATDAEPGPASEIVERLDALIERLRAALGPQAGH
jgi:hypothetical protein